MGRRARNNEGEDIVERVNVHELRAACRKFFKLTKEDYNKKGNLLAKFHAQALEIRDAVRMELQRAYEDGQTHSFVPSGEFKWAKI